jgi:hypothetical protein
MLSANRDKGSRLPIRSIPVKTAIVLWLAISILLAVGSAVWFFLQFPVSPNVSAALPEVSLRTGVLIIAGGLVALPAFKLPKKV